MCLHYKEFANFMYYLSDYLSRNNHEYKNGKDCRRVPSAAMTNPGWLACPRSPRFAFHPLDEVIPLPIRAYPTGGMANLR